MMITILLVDDHAVVREGYRRLLERHSDLRVVAEAATAAEAIERNESERPDVIVMDLALPGLSGIEAMRRILTRHPAAKVLIFSMHEDGIFARRALQAGARGYLTKGSAPDTLVRAVREVAQGRVHLSETLPRLLPLGHDEASGTAESISTREFELLALLAQGLSLATIAERLGVSPKTVANQQTLLKQKLGADNSVQLVLIAVRRGIIPAPTSLIEVE